MRRRLSALFLVAAGSRGSLRSRGLERASRSRAIPHAFEAAARDTDLPLGARYLRLLLDRFDSPDLALAAYSAGPTAVEKRGVAPSDTTVAYVANVTELWRQLRGCR